MKEIINVEDMYPEKMVTEEFYKKHGGKKIWKNYRAFAILPYKFDKNDDVEEILKNKFQEANPDIIVERVVIDCLYLFDPLIENTLKVWVHYKIEEDE